MTIYNFRLLQPPREFDITLEATEQEAARLVEQNNGFMFQYQQTWIALIYGKWFLILPPKQAVTNEVKLTKESLSSILWYTKGMIPAEDDDTYAFTFAKDKNGNFNENTRQLYHDISKFGKIRIDGFEYRIGGKDKNLISRSVSKKA